MSFPAYPSNVDSGVEWLGKVPSHWNPTRLRFLAQLNPSKTEVSELHPETEVSFVPMEAVGERGELFLGQTRPLSEVLTGYTYFREGDVSIAKITPCFENGKGTIMQGLLGGVGFGTTEFIVARARPDATTPKFLDWLFRSPAFRTRGEAAMYGAGGQKRVPDSFVRDFVSPGPPLNEQADIAAFLDRETAKIDALIEEQRRLVALLTEKRQAVISHAVTKGLDPHAPMKDSGIEWLGEVPAHWEVRPIGSMLRESPCYGVLVPDFEPNGVPMLRITDMDSGRAQRDRLNTISRALSDQYRRTIVEVGDLALSVVGTIGESLIIDEGLAGVNLSRAVARLRAAPVCDVRFLRWIFRAAFFQHFVDLTCVGAAQRVLNMGDLSSLRVVLPPSAEQVTIDRYLAQTVEALEALVLTAQSASTLLNERRAALISAAVTGKIDVRESAKVLPFPIDRARARGLIATEVIERSAHQATFGRVKLQKIAFLTETHVGVSELAGSYTREAAGPLDRAMIDEMEGGARSIAGVTVDQAGGTGTTVRYRLGQQRRAHRNELADYLGADRTAKLDKLIADFAALTTKGAEAVATLYAVWNDALIEGASPTEEDIVSGFLNDWHPEKAKKFRADELPEWLGWMRRHGVVPTGTGSKTATERLFA